MKRARGVKKERQKLKLAGKPKGKNIDISPKSKYPPCP
jgi:hypothetical protein